MRHELGCPRKVVVDYWKLCGHYVRLGGHTPLIVSTIVIKMEDFIVWIDRLAVIISGLIHKIFYFTDPFYRVVRFNLQRS